jgi:hypothetical protein
MALDASWVVFTAMPAPGQKATVSHQTQLVDSIPGHTAPIGAVGITLKPQQA